MGKDQDLAAVNVIDAVSDGDALEAVGMFHAPAPYTLIDSLFSDYAEARSQVEAMAAFMSDPKFGKTGALKHFVDGNCRDKRQTTFGMTEQLFQIEGALSHLNATYWQNALELTDVLELMPQARRTEWYEQIREMKTPEFTRENVEPTLEEMLRSRAKFFGERVDGVFRALSDTHLTNTPQGFYKRMIIAGVFDRFGFVEHRRSGYIHDLRLVIGRFMGRGEPKYQTSDSLLRRFKSKPGVWHSVDGGAFRVRVYGVGTAHVEVHPLMAYRLNLVLASLYPMAIASEYRKRPTKKIKDFVMVERPLPFPVIDDLADGRVDGNTFTFSYGHTADVNVRAEAIRTLESVGGTATEKGYSVEFDYDPKDVLDEITCTGVIPDQKAHQFYPTLPTVADDAVEFADIHPGHTIIEPSAGNGDLADRMPKDQVTCVEISPLRCKVLRAKGYEVIEADFLKWAGGLRQFDRAVLNPPFSDGRAQAHVQAAALLVKPGGKLVAVLPASHAGKVLLDGWDVSFSRVYKNEFAGTSVSVVIMTATNRPNRN